MKKETKAFFAQDNRLNKGYSSETARESNKNFFRKRFEHLFPPADVLQAFEDLHEGSVEKIICMAEKEQLHRQKLEETKILIAERMAKIALIAEIFITSIVCFSVISIASKGHSFVAICFAAFAFLTKFLIYKRNFAKQSSAAHAKDKKKY